MIRSSKRASLRTVFAIFPSTLTLAFLRLRQSLGLLVVMGIGITAAVMLVCAVPLYSRVAMSAGLRDAINSAPGGGEATVLSQANSISNTAINTNTQTLNSILQSDLGSYLTKPQFSIQTPGLPFLFYGTDKNGNPAQFQSRSQVQLVGYTMSETAPHIKLVKGWLPGDSSSTIEIALTQSTATQLNVTVGSVITTALDFFSRDGQNTTVPLQLHVVGIFEPVHVNDPYFHNIDFQIPPGTAGRNAPSLFMGLASQQALITTLTTICYMPNIQTSSFVNPAYLFWYYQFDIPHMSVDDLNSLLIGVNSAQVDTTDTLNQAPYIEQTRLTLPSDILTQYQGRVSVAQMIVVCLLALVVALVLFFVSMMADMLVDSQADAIAVLRSRGASGGQVVGALMLQSLLLSVLALIAGPLLAILLVRYLVMRVLPPADYGALGLISNNPVQVVVGLGWYSLAAVGVVLLAMSIAFLRISRVDILSARREAARATRRPLWQRLNLDVLAIVIALTGFAFSTYLTSSDYLDAGQRLLFLSPLTLMKSVFLLLAVILLFLRFFLPLLRLGAWIATRNRGAAPMLALAQMARTPSQSVRMTLLLALAITFSIFTLVFSASQSQRILDVAGYQGGADFGGQLGKIYDSATSNNLSQIQSQYSHVKGMASTTFGYTTTAAATVGSVYLNIEFRAIDANTFAKTAIWPDQNSAQPLKNLMQQLAEPRDALLSQLKPPKKPAKAPDVAIPALVDALTWQNLHLHQGSTFVLNFLDGYAKFVAVAEVQNIPTVNDSSQPGVSNYTAPGGVIVDYQTFSAYVQRIFANKATGVNFNYLWAKSYDDAASVASVRTTLTHGALSLATFYDRRAVIDGLHKDPLYLTLIGVLTLEVVTTLFLALMGALIASWLNVHKRLTNFALLRALGTAPRQIASVLTWEQGIVYITAVILGLVFGGLLSAYVLPSMVLTNIPPGGVSASITNVDTSQFYVLQTVPPVHLVVPGTLAIALVVLVVVCILVLGMMVRLVSSPSIAQTLRLNED